MASWGWCSPMATLNQVRLYDQWRCVSEGVSFLILGLKYIGTFVLMVPPPSLSPLIIHLERSQLLCCKLLCEVHVAEN